MSAERRLAPPCPVTLGASISSGAGKQRWTILILIIVFSALVLGLTQCIYHLQALSQSEGSGVGFPATRSWRPPAPVQLTGLRDRNGSNLLSSEAAEPLSADDRKPKGIGLAQTDDESHVVAPSGSSGAVAGGASLHRASATGEKLSPRSSESGAFSPHLLQLPRASPEFTAVGQRAAPGGSSFFDDGVSVVFPVVSGLTLLVLLGMYTGSLVDSVGFGIPLVVSGGLLSVGGVLWSYGLSSRSGIMTATGGVCAFLASFGEIPCYVILLLVFESKDVPLAYALWMGSRFGSLAVIQWTLLQLTRQKLDGHMVPSLPLSTSGNHAPFFAMSASLVGHRQAGPLLGQKFAKQLLEDPAFYASPLWRFLHIFSVASIVGGIVLVLLIVGLYVSVAFKRGESLPSYAGGQQSDALDGVSSWLHGFVHPIASNDAALLFLHEGYRSDALAGCQDGATGWLQSHYEGIIEKQCRWSVAGCLRVVPGLFVRGRLPLYQLANSEMWKFLLSNALFVTAMGMSTEILLAPEAGIAEMPLTGWLVGGHFCNTILINYTGSAQRKIWTVAAIAAPLLGSVFASCCPHKNLRATASMAVVLAFFLTLVGGSWTAASHVALGIALTCFRIGQCQALVAAVPLSYAGLAYAMTRVAEVVASVLAPYLVNAAAHALVGLRVSPDAHLVRASPAAPAGSSVPPGSLMALKSLAGEAAGTTVLTTAQDVGSPPSAAAYAFSHPSQTVAVWVFIVICVLQHFFFESLFCHVSFPRVDRLFRFDRTSGHQVLRASRYEEAPLLASRPDALQPQLQRQGHSMRRLPRHSRKNSTSFFPVQSTSQQPVETSRVDSSAPVLGRGESHEGCLSSSRVVGIGGGFQTAGRSPNSVSLPPPFGASEGIWGRGGEDSRVETPRLSHGFSRLHHNSCQSFPAKEVCVRFAGIAEASDRTDRNGRPSSCGTTVQQEDCLQAAPRSQLGRRGQSQAYLPRRKGQWRAERGSRRQTRGTESSQVLYPPENSGNRGGWANGDDFPWRTEDATLDDNFALPL